MKQINLVLDDPEWSYFEAARTAYGKDISDRALALAAVHAAMRSVPAERLLDDMPAPGKHKACWVNRILAIVVTALVSLNLCCYSILSHRLAAFETQMAASQKAAAHETNSLAGRVAAVERAVANIVPRPDPAVLELKRMAKTDEENIEVLQQGVVRLFEFLKFRPKKDSLGPSAP